MKEYLSRYKTIFYIILAVVLVAVLAFFLYQNFGPKEAPEKIESSVKAPPQELPQTNPFEEAKTNPFKDIKTNPFE